MNPEPVRLVIWDLDETFWRGTVTEGGIREYVQAHHDIVIALARRGIMSSICSKNDLANIAAILRDHGIWDYFIFPSIDWTPKGARIAELVERVGLRPPTVLFVDDNPGNRAEAAAALPGLQIADETLLAELLADPRLIGKSDPELTRLKQYKLLEQKQQDERAAGGDNTQFLRDCHIRVTFEYDVETHIDRAIELINRTNQLNFIKQRLPETTPEARAALREQLGVYWCQAALVRVEDRYGDYGFCGFFFRINGQGEGSGQLRHFCFSCRTLGMGVEEFVYDYLGRPQLHVIGDVLTDLSQARHIDWINAASAATDRPASHRVSIPEVRLRGGCEVDALVHYFAGVTAHRQQEGNATRRPFFARRDCSHHLWTPGQPPPGADYLALAQACGFVASDFTGPFLSPCAPGTLLIFSLWGDLVNSYRHRQSQRLLTPAIGFLQHDVLTIPTEDIEAHLGHFGFDAAERAEFWRAVEHLRQHADFVGIPPEDELRANLHRIFQALPEGCVAAALAIDAFDAYGGHTIPNPSAQAYNQCLREVAAAHGVEVFDIGDHVLTPEERTETAHFNRIVYFRLASAIIDWAAARPITPPAPPAPAPAPACPVPAALPT